MENFEVLKLKVDRILAPMQPLESQIKVPKDFLHKAVRTDGGRLMRSREQVYFLFVKLLGYRNLGRGEKVAWSIPVYYKDHPFLIEHRKFGLGVFALKNESTEKLALEISQKVNKAIRIAEPFYTSLAAEASRQSKLNLVNHCAELYERFSYHKIRSKTFLEKDDHKSYKAGVWEAMAAIEAFFSWTEHVFVHLAIMLGKIPSGDDLQVAMGQDWATKAKLVLDLSDKKTKSLFDKTHRIRADIRNFAAHGSFGKLGHALYFHSPIGAVPVDLSGDFRSPHFSVSRDVNYNFKEVLNCLEEFGNNIWREECEFAKLYLMERDFPTIMTFARNGRYQEALESEEAMAELISDLEINEIRSANMDW